MGIVQGDIDALLRDAGDENLDRVSILPVDPTRVLCKANAMVVQTAARKQLVQACRAGGADRYALALSAMGGIEALRLTQIGIVGMHSEDRQTSTQIE